MAARARPGRRTRAPTTTIRDGRVRRRRDWVATEEPLEIRVRAGTETARVAVTMRTPGADFDLAAGFLLAEGVVSTAAEIAGISYCRDPALDDGQRYNVVTVDLAAPALPRLGRLRRHGTITSACGVCGKTSLQALAAEGLAPVADPPARVAPAVLTSLPGRLREAQELFDTTGGLHAAAAFDAATGALRSVREDVGRHNALDKLLGGALLEGRVPLEGAVVLVSGRASFELAQKTAASGAAVLAAISAPSSLAIDVADRFGVTLVAFLRGEHMNVYTHPERIATGGPDDGPTTEPTTGQTTEQATERHTTEPAVGPAD